MYSIMRRGIRALAIFAILFAFSYAIVEYYLIRDTTLGYGPVLFSLIYPYHFGMALVFGLVAYGFSRAFVNTKGFVPSFIIVCTLFSSMLSIEDFAWFILRAVAPVQGDINAGRLVMPGEWTTQFMGSVNVQLTAIPNWYFLSIVFLAIGWTLQRERPLAIPIICSRRKSRRPASFLESVSF